MLDAPGAADGVVAPLVATPVSLVGRNGTAPLDPIAFPGVESVERQGAPPRAGLAETPRPPSASRCVPPPTRGRHRRSSPVQWPLDVPHVPPTDRYSLRLVAGRRLYDLGAAVRATPALADLVGEASAPGEPLRPRRPRGRGRR